MNNKKNIESLKFHPWVKTGMVEWVPVSFVYNLRNKMSTNKTNDLKGIIKPEKEIWKDIVENGMFEPFLITIGVKNQNIRLESGNHRIKFANQENCLVPVALFIYPEDCLVHKGNGEHFYSTEGLVFFNKLFNINYVYQEKPSNVLMLDGIKDFIFDF